MKQSFIARFVLLLLWGTSLAGASRSLAQDAPADAKPPAGAAPTTPATAATPTAPVAPVTPPVAAPPTPGSTPAGTGDASTIKEATIAYNNGVAALKKNDLDGAATQFQQAVALAPKDAKAQMFLGYVRLQQGRYPEALAALQAAQTQGTGLDAKETAQLNNNIGNVYWKQERQAEAITAFQKAVDGDPEYMDARYNLAFALFARKNYKDALPHFSYLLAKTPPDPALDLAAVYDARGAVYEKLAQWSKAVGDYRKASELDKKEPSYAFNLALAMLNSGRLNDAIAPLQEVIRRDPRHEQAHLLLGDVYIKKKIWKKAQESLESYVALRPDEFACQFNLGVSYDYAGQFT
jgi:Flp pilus assembly protein TadD